MPKTLTQKVYVKNPPRYVVGTIAGKKYSKRKYPTKKQLIVAGYTRTAGPYARAVGGRPGGITLKGTIEKKYKDNTFADFNVTPAGVVATNVLNIAQGTTEVTRVGGKITVTNVNLRGSVGNDNAGAQGPDIVRMIIFWDLQCNGALPNVTDVLTTADWRSYLNMDNVDRFKIIKDKCFIVDITTWDSTNALGAQKLIKVNHKCSIPIHYSSTTGAIAEIKSNNLCIIWLSRNNASIANYTIRVKFTDA